MNSTIGRARSSRSSFDDLRAVGETPFRDQIDRRKADRVHAPGLLAHRQDAVGGLLVGGEVQVRQLGHGVTHRVVERAAFGEIAALDVRGRDVHLVAATTAARPSKRSA